MAEQLPSGKIQVEIFAEAEVRRTESSEKIAEAFRKILGEKGDLEVERDRVTFSSNDVESLRFMKDQFRDRRVRSAARRLLLSRSTEIETHLLLNKQAATVGIAAICDDAKESPLGPIVLRLRSENVARVIDWLTQGYADGS